MRSRGRAGYRGIAVAGAAVFLLVAQSAFPLQAHEVTADDFRQSHFKGFNFAEVKDGLPTSANLDAMQASGANVGRIFFAPLRCKLCLSYSLDAGDLRTLDALIEAMHTRSMYVVVVLTLGGDERGTLWWSTSLQDSFVETWRQLAARYRNVATIAGFDLLNEPVPPGKTYDIRQSTWLAYAERLGAAVRTADPERVLIVESAPDATPTSFDNLHPLMLSNVVYSVHSYFPMALTHQGVMKPYDDPVTYDPSPAAEHGRQELYGYLSQVAAFGKRYDVPILVGEFSCAKWAPNGSAERYIADSLVYFEAQGWSWTYHEYRRWYGWDAEMQPGTHEQTPRSVNAPVMTVLRARLRSTH
jgi:hypothetical protein